MLDIDGSYGEGGGQILRSALALSILTHTPIRVFNIRAHRPTSGLKPQHHTIISILQTLSDAETYGVSIGSSTIEFFPKPIKPGQYRFSVGTAGSIVLIYQTMLAALLHITSPIQITLTGGTDVKWAPSWDYFTQVFCPCLTTRGIHCFPKLERRGYYPKGNGKAILQVDPIESVHPDIPKISSAITRINGNIHSSGLPDHIGKRMKQAVAKRALQHNIHATITQEDTQTSSPGVVLTLWVDNPTRFLGCVGLGERGVSAEHISHRCLNHLITFIQSNAMVDPWLFDQLLLFLICSKGVSTISVPFLSKHARTNMWLCNQFFADVSLFDITQENQRVLVTINGQDIGGLNR